MRGKNEHLVNLLYNIKTLPNVIKNNFLGVIITLNHYY